MENISNKWIEVVEKLPNKNGKYLCVNLYWTDNFPVVEILDYVEKIKYGDERYFSQHWGRRCVFVRKNLKGIDVEENVSHWMNLPELPLE